MRWLALWLFWMIFIFGSLTDYLPEPWKIFGAFLTTGIAIVVFFYEKIRLASLKEENN